LRRVEPLIAEENDLVLEKCFPYFLLGYIPREIDAEELRAERTGNSLDFYCSTLMFWLLMIEP
jgi:hypothetical protein